MGDLDLDRRVILALSDHGMALCAHSGSSDWLPKQGFFTEGQAVRGSPGRNPFQNPISPCPPLPAGSFDYFVCEMTSACHPGSGSPDPSCSPLSIPERKVVPPPRFEHGTHRLGICCSILLSYGGTIRTYLIYLMNIGLLARPSFPVPTEGNQITPTDGIPPYFMPAAG